MPVKRRIPKTRRAEIPQWHIDYLLSGEEPAQDDKSINRFAVLKFRHEPHGHSPAKDLWREIGEELVAEWIERRPGTRPYAWWLWDAPRQLAGVYPGFWFDGTLPAPRLRLGGRGTPCHEVLAYVPCFEYGFPVPWLDDWTIAYYSGRARDIHGNPIGIEFMGREFRAERFDPDDPPTFESSASYLKRHGLLHEREGARLTLKDYQPETLPPEFWPDDDKDPT